MEKDDINKIQLFLQRQQEEVEKKRKNSESFTRQTKQLNQELYAVGVLGHEENLWDLVMKKTPYPQAIPILLKYLRLRHKLDWEPRVHESLIMALDVKESCGLAGNALIEEFKKEKNPDVAFRIGDVLRTVATPEDGKALIEIALNESFGQSRAMLPLALSKALGNASIPYLLTLLEAKEQVVQGVAIQALGELRAYEARGKIEPFLSHKDSWVRGEARKAIKKFDTYLKRMQAKLDKETKPR